MSAQLPYAIQDFTKDMQTKFRQAIADAADVGAFRVKILSISAAQSARRLLDASIIVEFRVRVPPNSEAGSIIEAMAPASINTNLEIQGLMSISTVVKDAHLQQAGGACGTSGFNGFSVAAYLTTNFGAQPPWVDGQWNGTLKHTTLDNPGGWGPIRNKTAHEEYLSTCQDNTSWVDSRGHNCAWYAEEGVTPWDNGCTDHEDPPENYAQDGIDAWQACCACRVHREVQYLKGKVALIPRFSVDYFAGGGWSVYTGSEWAYTLRAWRAQMAGATAAVFYNSVGSSGTEPHSNFGKHSGEDFEDSITIPVVGISGVAGFALLDELALGHEVSVKPGVNDDESNHHPISEGWDGDAVVTITSVCSTCKPGTFSGPNEATLNQTTVCRKCAPGTFSANSGRCSYVHACVHAACICTPLAGGSSISESFDCRTLRAGAQECRACPENAHSKAGSSLCVCDAGYAERDGECVPCAANADSPAGSNTCMCNAGFSMSDDGSCTYCAQGLLPCCDCCSLPTKPHPICAWAVQTALVHDCLVQLSVDRCARSSEPMLEESLRHNMHERRTGRGIRGGGGEMKPGKTRFSREVQSVRLFRIEGPSKRPVAIGGPSLSLGVPLEPKTNRYVRVRVRACVRACVLFI